MNRVFSNILYNCAYQLLLILLPLITIPYISRILGPSNIGIYSYYFTFAAFFVMVSRLGVANYGSRSIAEVVEERSSLNRVFSEIFSLQLLVSSFTAIAYCVLFFFSDHPSVYLSAGLYVLSGMLDISWLYFGMEEFKKTALRSMLVKCVSVVLIFVCVRNENDLVPYTLICCGAHLVTNLALWLMLPMVHVKFSFRISKALLSHLKPMLVLFLPVIGVSLYNYLDKMMLGSMAGNDELGFFHSAESIMSVPISLIAGLGTVMLPRMTNLYSKGESGRASKHLMLSMWLALAVVSAFAFGIISVSPEFVSLFYGPGFERCILLLRVLMLATIFVAMANVIRTQILIPLKMDKVYVISIFSAAVVNIILNLLLIPGYGALGASIATVAAEYVVFVIQTAYCFRKDAVGKHILRGLPFVLFGIIMVAVLCMIPACNSVLLTLALKMVIGGVLYLVLSGGYYVLYLRKC